MSITVQSPGNMDLNDDPLKLKPGRDSLGWGLIGASNMARETMVEAIRQQPAAPGAPAIAGAWIVGVFSHDPGRAQDFANRTHIPLSFSRLETLLDRTDVHCVYVSSHPRLHQDLTLAAMEAGKHVLCEAPLALSPTGARAVQQAAQKHGVVLAVNHAARADAALVRLRKLLQDGAVGDVLGGQINNTAYLHPARHTWRLQPGGGGVILDRTLHDIDLLRWLFQDEIDQVTALAGPPMLGEGVEDDIVAGLHLVRQKVIFQVHDSFLVPHRHNSLEIYGTQGTLIAFNCLTRQGCNELLLVRNYSARPVPLEPNQPYRAFVHAFNAAVRKQAPSPTTTGDGIRNLRVALAVRQSIRSEAVVSISWPASP